MELPIPVVPAMEEMLMIFPPPLLLMAGTAARQQKKVPLRFTARLLSQISSVSPSRSDVGRFAGLAYERLDVIYEWIAHMHRCGSLLQAQHFVRRQGG